MEKILSYIKKYSVYIIILLLIYLGYSLYVSENNNSEVIEPIEEAIKETIKVDIKGAVNNPGVYELNVNSIVDDAINASGGLSELADTSTINLSKTLTDEMVIIIYSKDEIEEMRDGVTSIKYIENECICPQIKNDACIEEVITNIEVVDKTKNQDDEKIQNEEEKKININTSNIDELTTLSGIGEAKAKKIIEYRDNNGEFKNIEEIMNVSGIGQAIYEKIKNNITV